MKKLKLHSGDGRYNWPIPQKGVFKIDTDAALEKTLFSELSEAMKVYDSIEAEKAIWSISGVPELIEAHSYEEINADGDMPYPPFMSPGKRR